MGTNDTQTTLAQFLAAIAALSLSGGVHAAEVKTACNERSDLKVGFDCLLHKDVQTPVKFEGLYNFDGPAKRGDTDKPWRGLKVSDPAKALELSLKTQRYVYEGWFQNVDVQNTDLHFRKNDHRTWCSTPWLNTDPDKGRETAHGLTKEFPLNPEAIERYYPGIGIKPFKKTSWGTAFFNKPTCEIYQKVFGSPSTPLDPTLATVEKHKAGQHLPLVADGSVSFKMLFSSVTAAEYPGFQNSYQWTAHVSGPSAPPGAPPVARSIQKMPHLQMDIAIKDGEILGLAEAQKVDKAEAIPWIMLTYYYDPTYNADESPEAAKILKGLNLPEGLKKMRPLGIQYGLDRGQSVIFEKALNNHYVDDVENRFQFPADYNFSEHQGDTPNGRLNGPADNPKSSCLGCHALAILETDELKIADKKVGVSPGVLSNPTYKTQVQKTKLHFDFNHQMRIGLDNYFDWLKAQNPVPAK